MLAELVEAGTLGLETEEADTGGSNVDVAPTSKFNIADLATVELGAGTALPSMMSALLGARRVVVTDYPAPVVIEMLRDNVMTNVKPSFSPFGKIPAAGSQTGPGAGVEVEGHRWGELDTPLATTNKHAFDRVLVADCLWMPWEHDNLRKSISWFMKDDPTSRGWVVAGFHTGREKMRGFFDGEALAREGLEVELIWERDCNGINREWAWDRGIEDITVRKRWLTVAVLRKRSRKT